MTHTAMLLRLLLLVHGFAAFFLLLYGVNCYIMLVLHRRARERMLRHDEACWKTQSAVDRQLPHITVQLPIYNERYVIQRLIEAIVRLQYPRDRLEIQILDDSTDGTTAIGARLVESYRQQGFDITLCHRQHRFGFKAGALQEGLAVAKGEFIAIFDADFVPEPDFLRRTLPFFQDPAVAMVQSRWGHINRDYSVLTLAQSFGIDGHFWVEQTARCWSGLFMNFNGSGGIWRRTAIDDAGGWQTDTLTEDLDLSYRARLRGWRLKFLPQVICPAEIPVQMSSLKNQQHRWAKGSIQTVKKLIPDVLRADLSVFTKYQAICHLTNYLVHPFMLLTALTFPLLCRFDVDFSGREYLPGIVGSLFATFGPSSMYLYAQSQLYPDWKRRLPYFPFLLIFGTGIALNNTKAIWEALINVSSPFVRTPKFHIEGPSDTWVGKRYRVAFPWLSLGEAGLAFYCAYGVFLSLRQGLYAVSPFLLLYMLGFASVALVSFWEVWRKRQFRRRQPQGMRAGKPSWPNWRKKRDALLSQLYH
jgi:cellulose synthase/poly-beta-1,6-N-acetylglucosamine synthase-like glycosyltransferase